LLGLELSIDYLYSLALWFIFPGHIPSLRYYLLKSFTFFSTNPAGLGSVTGGIGLSIRLLILESLVWIEGLTRLSCCCCCP
jgi:hypothetical protein